VIYFTADHHFGHKNIIEYTNRPFSTVGEMDEALITAWNETVDLDDRVYHLGDFTLGAFGSANRFFIRLNGQIKIVQVRS